MGWNDTLTESECEEWGLLATCEELRMNASGASDSYGPVAREVMAGYLRRRLTGWREGVAWAKRYDDAVKELVGAALAEYEWRKR